MEDLKLVFMINGCGEHAPQELLVKMLGEMFFATLLKQQI
jgi:hypothetical protein